MKIHIWIDKKEAVSGNITKWYTFGPPQSSNWPDYVQVSITQDEFARLEDSKYTNFDTQQNYTYPEFAEKHYKSERVEDE